MNPWAAHIADRNPLDIISQTAGRLAELVATLVPERLGPSPAPGKWSVRDILCHLTDGEVVFGFRLRQSLAEDHHVIQPFDQDRWAKVYGAYDAQTALAAFTAVRAWNLSLIRSLDAAALSKRLTHPERGEMTLETIIETMAGHDLNHIQQMEKIVSQPASAG